MQPRVHHATRPTDRLLPTHSGQRRPPPRVAAGGPPTYPPRYCTLAGAPRHHTRAKNRQTDRQTEGQTETVGWQQQAPRRLRRLFWRSGMWWPAAGVVRITAREGWSVALGAARPPHLSPTKQRSTKKDAHAPIRARARARGSDGVKTGTFFCASCCCRRARRALRARAAFESQPPSAHPRGTRNVAGGLCVCVDVCVVTGEWRWPLCAVHVLLGAARASYAARAVLPGWRPDENAGRRTRGRRVEVCAMTRERAQSMLGACTWRCGAVSLTILSQSGGRGGDVPNSVSVVSPSVLLPAV